MKYLLYHKRSYKSGRGLATQLGLKPTRNVGKLIRSNNPPVIRYGNSDNDFGKRDTKINAPFVIKLCANSYRFGLWCEEHNYFTPRYRRFHLNKIPEFPFLLRKLHHRAGKDIIVINNKDDLNKVNRDVLIQRYWVPYIETTFELRVHVIDGKIARIFKKIKPGALDDGEFIRTANKDWKYSLRTNTNEKYGKAQALCLKLAKDLGLFFGGIDIAWDNKNKRYIIWEVNTAPGLNSQTLKIYADILRGCL